MIRSCPLAQKYCDWCEFLLLYQDLNVSCKFSDYEPQSTIVKDPKNFREFLICPASLIILQGAEGITKDKLAKLPPVKKYFWYGFCY